MLGVEKILTKSNDRDTKPKNTTNQNARARASKNMNNEELFVPKKTDKEEESDKEKNQVRILIPIDMASYKHAFEAVKFCIQNTCPTPSKSCAIHFLTILPRDYLSEYTSDISQNGSKCIKNEAILEKWFKSICLDNEIACSFEALELGGKVKSSEIANIIVERTVRFGGNVYTLIVMNKHNTARNNLNIVEEFFLGSVCKEVLRKSCVPVCIVPT